MGSSEETPTLWTELFWRREDAVQHAIVFCSSKGANSQKMEYVQNLDHKDNVDALTWGFSIEKVNIR